MTGISSQAIADAVGISRRAVNKAAHRGHLTRGSDGRFDPEASPNREWIEQRARLRGDGRGRPLPLPAPNGSGTAVEIQTSPQPEAPTELPGPDGGLFSDWTALRIDRDAADRLLREVPAERTDQIAFLTLMMEGLRAAVAEGLEAQRAEMRAEILVLWQAAIEGRQDLAELIGILGGQKPATGPAGAPEPEPLAGKARRKRRRPIGGFPAAGARHKEAGLYRARPAKFKPQHPRARSNATETPEAMTRWSGAQPGGEARGHMGERSRHPRLPAAGRGPAGARNSTGFAEGASLRHRVDRRGLLPRRRAVGADPAARYRRVPQTDRGVATAAAG